MKKLQNLFLLLIGLLFFTGCVSTPTTTKSEDGIFFKDPLTNEKFIITEWKYMGFGQPFPQWVVPALENNTEKLHNYFTDLLIPEGSSVIILTGKGYNQDQAENDLKRQKKPEKYKLADTFWVGTYLESDNEISSNIEKMYISVAVYYK